MEDSLDSFNMNKTGTEPSLSDQGLDYLREAAKWGKFLGIIGFIMVGLIAIASFFMGTVLSSMPTGGMQMPAQGFMVTIIYLLMALLYFFPTLYLYQFSTKTLDAIARKDGQLLDNGLEKLKSLFKFMGIMTVIVLGLYALIFVVAIIGGVASM